MANPLIPGLLPPRGDAASASSDNLASWGDCQGLFKHCPGEMKVEQASLPLGARRGLDETAAPLPGVAELPKGMTGAGEARGRCVLMA